MLTSLSIQNFRRFRELKFDSLDRINLIIGKNNCGKTAVLEALCLLFSDEKTFANLPVTFRMSQQNHQDNLRNFWLYLALQTDVPILIEAIFADIKIQSVREFSLQSKDFPNPDAQPERVRIELEYKHQIPSPKLNLPPGADVLNASIIKDMAAVVWKGAHGRPVRNEWPVMQTFSVFPSSPTQDADVFNRIAVRKGGEEKLVRLLKVIDPRLQALRYLKLGNEPIIYADVGMENLIPATQLGQGFNRLLRFYCETLYGQAQIVLIDEIENGIHYSALNQIWAGIAELARQENIQIFDTTHSYECIRAAHETIGATGTYDLAVHRLEEDRKGEVQVKTYDQETLGTSFELDWEVR